MNAIQKLKEMVSRLYDEGYRGNSDAYKGIKIVDEQHLASLLLQVDSDDPIQMIALEELDTKNSFPKMLSRFIMNPTDYEACEIANFLSSLYTHDYKDKIQQLFDEAHYESAEAEREREEQRNDERRMLHSYNKDRI